MATKAIASAVCLCLCGVHALPGPIPRNVRQAATGSMPPVCNGPDKCLDFAALATGAAAYTYCMNVLASNRTEASAKATDLDLPGLPPGLKYNATEHSVTVSFPGTNTTRTANVVQGFACQMVFDENIAPILPPANTTNSTDNWPEALQGSTNAFADVDYAQLAGLLGREFDVAANETYVKGARTKAVVVVHRGHVVYEQYADWLNITRGTPLVGWSMTKSLTAALVGMRIADGKMDLDGLAANPFWTADEKKLRNVTVRSLVEMTSGIRWDEDYGAVTDVTRMLFTTPSIPAYVASHPQTHVAGSQWQYSSGNSNLLMHALRLSFSADGGDSAYWAYPQQRLFGPMGAHSMQLATDSMGTFVGSSFSLATARDWARFGQLHLNNGTWQGRSVLADGWAEYSRMPVAGSNGTYSASVWLLAGEGSDDYSDGFYCGGYAGQVVAVFPSRDLVVVRLGYTLGFDDFDRNALVRKVAALFKRKV